MIIKVAPARYGDSLVSAHLQYTVQADGVYELVRLNTPNRFISNNSSVKFDGGGAIDWEYFIGTSRCSTSTMDVYKEYEYEGQYGGAV